MNSQTHVLMGAVLFGRPLPRLAWAGAAGGVVPDLPMYAIVATLAATGHSTREIFDRIYWEEWWQIANALGHSFLLWGGLAIAAQIAIARRKGGGFPNAISPYAGAAPMVLAFSASAFLHSLIDFMLHRDDAHMHFWPLSEWRFRSPVSYWDSNFYGDWFGLFEAALGVALAIVLFRRYHSRLLRAALLVAMTLYVAVPAFFILYHHA